jgi:hypothetical protein
MWGHGAHWDQTVGRSGACSSWIGRGDWCHMHKLAETIRAYRSALWEPWK